MTTPEFCGQDACLIDGNGRIKLTPRFLTDFRQRGPEVVLHCLAEGALGVYPVGVWQQMRQAEPRPAARAGSSLVFRRQLRRFGAFSQPDSISNQGRITIPLQFRDETMLLPGTEVVLVGCEIGVEIWNTQRWKAEAEIVRQHELQRGEIEMHADLNFSPSSHLEHKP